MTNSHESSRAASGTSTKQVRVDLEEVDVKVLASLEKLASATELHNAPSDEVRERLAELHSQLPQYVAKYKQHVEKRHGTPHKSTSSATNNRRPVNTAVTSRTQTPAQDSRVSTPSPSRRRSSGSHTSRTPAGTPESRIRRSFPNSWLLCDIRLVTVVLLC